MNNMNKSSLIRERIEELRILMKNNDIDIYIICTNDFHGSEYVGEYFKTRQFMSGFTGSAGTLLVTASEARLWTDGRYFIQAENELENTNIMLMKAGQNGVPTISEFVSENIGEEGIIGFDGRTVSIGFVNQILLKCEGKNIRFVYEVDLVDAIWKDRPQLLDNKIWLLDEKYSGEKADRKIERLRMALDDNNADVIIINSLDEIAWLLNLRGDDVAFNPVFLSYMLVWKKDVALFVDENKIDEAVRKSVYDLGVRICAYDEFYDALGALKPNSNVLYDSAKVNYSIYKSLNDDIKIIDKTSPITFMKAIKNEVEYLNERNAHIKDGVAVTKFMYWLKHNFDINEISEIDAGYKLELFRKEQENYLGQSFEPIMAYGEHGAIVHYQATDESNVIIKRGGLLLSDTGGHYLEGTTDITRTYVIGEASEEEKKLFTLVLAGHLNLMNAKFVYGLTGRNLDYLARGPLWKYGYDYNHGTGHGVGYLLNVHEAPNSFGWHKRGKDGNDITFEEGMITSNEPGVYIKGKFGIRHENLVLCVKDEVTEYGQFMRFDNLTMVPFDIEGIDKKYLSSEQIEILNRYHKEVFEAISPYFEGEELEWLKGVTKQI